MKADFTNINSNLITFREKILGLRFYGSRQTSQYFQKNELPEIFEDQFPKDFSISERFIL